MRSSDLPLREASPPTLDCEALLGSNGPMREQVLAWFAEQCRSVEASLVIGLESWGYLFALPTALTNGIGLAVARRRTDRLSADSVCVTYDMNATKGNSIGMERSSVKPGTKAMLVDDSVVSGKTLAAVGEIVRQMGGEVAAGCAVVGVDQARTDATRALGAPLRCYRWI